MGKFSMAIEYMCCIFHAKIINASLSLTYTTQSDKVESREIDIFSANKHPNCHKVTIWSYIIIKYLLLSQIYYQSISSFEPIYFDDTIQLQ